jgi:hypothetical protein
VQEWGAERASPRDATVADIHTAIRAVLGDPSCRASAVRLSGPPEFLLWQSPSLGLDQAAD